MSDFRARELLLEALFSASDSSRRSREYSVKSPRWQVIALLKPARDSSRLRTCLASPTTERSAWNWAKEDSRISRARAPAELGQQVDAHVVRGPETGVQRVGPPGGEAGHGGRVGAGLPQHHRVALDVDAAAAGPAGQLGVLPRRDVDVGFAVELVQLFQHHASAPAC